MGAGSPIQVMSDEMAAKTLSQFSNGAKTLQQPVQQNMYGNSGYVDRNPIQSLSQLQNMPGLSSYQRGLLGVPKGL